MRSTLRIAAGLGLAVLAGSAAWAADGDFKAIFDGSGASGWKTNTGKPVPSANVQPDGLNPHKAGGYLVVHETPLKDFVLEFDYKLSKGCNSGVFVRVGDLKDPVMTGLEIALDDTTGKGLHDSGAFYDLVPPSKNAQKPAGAWNHMVIAAKGPRIEVTLNGTVVSTLDHEAWHEPGKRPDGSDHKFKGVSIRNLNQKGYFGFQDHGQDCWFKDVKVKALD